MAWQSFNYINTETVRAPRSQERGRGYCTPCLTFTRKIRINWVIVTKGVPLVPPELCIDADFLQTNCQRDRTIDGIASSSGPYPTKMSKYYVRKLKHVTLSLENCFCAIEYL